MENPLRRPGRYIVLLAQAADGTYLYCKIDRDADYLFDLDIYCGPGPAMEVITVWGVTRSTVSNTLYAAIASGHNLQHVALVLDAPFHPRPKKRTLMGLVDRLIESIDVKTHIDDKKFLRRNPANYDITEGADGTLEIRPRGN